MSCDWVPTQQPWDCNGLYVLPRETLASTVDSLILNHAISALSQAGTLGFSCYKFCSIPTCFSNHSFALSFSSRMMVQQLQEPVPRGAPLAELLHSVQGANLGKKGDSMRI
jgi:hypothetical protein